MERISGVLRGGTSLYVVNLRAFVHDNQRTLKLTNVGRIQAEICLQGQIYFDTFGNVHKRSTGPDSTIKRGQGVIFDGNDRTEIFPEQIRVLA